jgi:single-strand DNA-binding protein
MRGVNKVILVGNIGGDPETRYTTSGTAITEMSVATSEQWTDKQSGEKQERTEWHRITMFGKLAEIAGEYCKKGGQVYIEGSIRTDKYTDKQGVEKYSTKVIAETMQLLGGKREGEERSERPSQDNNRRQGAVDRARQGAAGHSQPPSEQGGFNDDEIPF